MSQAFGITEYPNTFKRQGSFPLDKSSVFSSLNDATEYAKSSLIAYEGQIISVIENDIPTPYILKRSTNSDAMYELMSLSSSIDINNTIINMNNLINSKVGIWIINENSNGDACLDFDILYSINADAYEVFFNDESVSNVLSLTDEFITTLDNFKNDSVLITIKFYNNNLPVFKLNAIPLYKNKTVIFGNLYLIELFDTEVS